MKLSLVRKELQEHAVGFLLLGLSLAAVLALVVVGARVGHQERGPLDALRSYVVLATLMGASVVNQLLITREYSGRTQLFLETLPIPRRTILLTKLGLGLAITLGTLVPAVAACAALAWSPLAMDPRFLLILAARALAFGLFGYAFFFAFSFLGRYRFPCLILATVALAYVAEATDVVLERAGPFALLDGTFASERAVAPSEHLLWTLGLSAFLLAVGLLLGLQREGSVAALLAQSMSQREKAFVAVIIVSSMVAVAALEGRRQKEPFDLKDAVEVHGSGARVELSPASLPAGRELAERVHGELVELTEYLGAPALPPVFLTARRDLDPFRFERGRVGEAEGLLVRLRYPAEPWSDEPLAAWVVREALATHTRGRALREPGRWLLDGIGLYWARRSAAGQPLSSTPDLTLRALYGTPDGVSKQTVDRWLRFREHVGEDVASAVAWSGLATLARQVGPERVQRLLRATLGARPDKDVRAVWSAWRSPFARTFERETGVGYDAFLTRWRADLEAERSLQAQRLARVPRLEGALRVAPLSGGTRRLSYASRISPPTADGTPVHFRYAQLPLFDTELAPDTIRSEDRFAPLPDDTELPGTWARGARLAWTVALRSEELGCEVISGWQRQQVP